MSSASLKPKPTPAVSGSDAAPIVYCDGIVAAGMLGGIVQLELAANCLIPLELDNSKPPRSRVLVTGHIRCSAQAALAIRDSIDKLLRVPAAEPAIRTAAKPQAKPAAAKPKTKPPAMPEIERHEMTRAPAPSELAAGE